MHARACALCAGYIRAEVLTGLHSGPPATTLSIALALNLALDIALVALHGGGKVKQNDRGIWREAERVAVGVQVVRSSATCWGWDEDRGACANVCCGKSILRVVPQVAWLVAQSV